MDFQLQLAVLFFRVGLLLHVALETAAFPELRAGAVEDPCSLIPGTFISGVLGALCLPLGKIDFLQCHSNRCRGACTKASGLVT